MKTKPKEELLERIVSADENGIRLDRCLRLWIPKLLQSLIEKGARKGLLRVEDAKVKPSYRVVEGQKVTFPQSLSNLEVESEEKKQKILTRAEQQWIKNHIIYEDSDVVVLNKPAGIAVQSGTKQRKSLDRLLEAYYEDCKPRLVHRLDLDTSGVLVLAKTLPMARWLTQAFKERKIQKVYWALVAGVPKKKEGMISLALTKKQGALSEKIQVDSENGLQATTYFRIIEALGNRVAWLELLPKTGRTHQLRVHCAEGLNTPILGDEKYGEKDEFSSKYKRLHLHAKSITIPLQNGKSNTFDAPLPEDLQKTFHELGFQDV